MNKEHFAKHQTEIESGLTEEDELYRENILDHYKHPHNKGQLKSYSCTHHELNPTCGDEITLYLDIKNEKIVAVMFDGHGCAISQSAASMLTDAIKGMSVKDAKALTKDDIYKMLGIPISVNRIKCALLSLKTLQEGLKQ